MEVAMNGTGVEAFWHLMPKPAGCGDFLEPPPVMGAGIVKVLPRRPSGSNRCDKDLLKLRPGRGDRLGFDHESVVPGSVMTVSPAKRCPDCGEVVTEPGQEKCPKHQRGKGH